MRYFAGHIYDSDKANTDDEYSRLFVVEAHDEDEAHGKIDEHLMLEVERTDRTGLQITYVAPCVKWVNAYAVSQAYAGPEEGGWYHTIRECVASMPVISSAEADEIKARMNGAIGWENAHNRYSVVGTTDFEMAVETERAQSDNHRDPIPHYS